MQLKRHKERIDSNYNLSNYIITWLVRHFHCSFLVNENAASLLRWINNILMVRNSITNETLFQMIRFDKNRLLIWFSSSYLQSLDKSRARYINIHFRHRHSGFLNIVVQMHCSFQEEPIQSEKHVGGNEWNIIWSNFNDSLNLFHLYIRCQST